MSTFAEILEKKLGRKLSGDRTITTEVRTALETKGLALKGTFEWSGDRLNEEADLSKFVADAEYAAALRVDEILGGLVHQDLWDLPTKTKYRTTSKVEVPETVYGIRNKLGHPMNGLQLARILNLTLHDEVQRLMKSARTLNYQSGRLANSAQVGKIGYRGAAGSERKGRVSIFFQYMLAPYEVFEPGHDMHKQGRSPTVLIKKAIMNSLRNILSPTSFKTNIFNTERK